MPSIPIIQRAKEHPNRIAVVTAKKNYTYQYLLDHSEAFAKSLLNGKKDLQEVCCQSLEMR